MLLVTMYLCNLQAIRGRIESGESTLKVPSKTGLIRMWTSELLLLIRVLQAEKRGCRPVATKVPCLMSLHDDGGDMPTREFTT